MAFDSGTSTLRRRYSRWCVAPSGELFMPPLVALQFVEDCNALCVKTIGAEAFKSDGDKLLPLLNEIADWSDVSHLDYKVLNQATREFLERLAERSDIRVSISVMD